MISPDDLLRCLALWFGIIKVSKGTRLRIPPRLLSTPLFEARIAPCCSNIGAVLLSTITRPAHTLQIVNVVVWWVGWNDVVDSPIVAI